MAKIKFKEYLKNRLKVDTVYESDEGLIKRARQRLESDEYIVSAAYRVTNLNAALQLLEQVEEKTPEAEALIEKCHQELSGAQTEATREQYDKACLHLSEATDASDYTRVIDELKELGDYKDSPGLLSRAEAGLAKLNHRYNIIRAIVLAVIAVLVILAAAAVKTGYAKYMIAKIEGISGVYKSAYSRFYKLGDFLDSREQSKYYKKLYRQQREAEESKSLADADEGDTVDFGDYEWYVLKKEDSVLTLLCADAETDDPDIDAQAFSHVAFNDTAADVTWETSTLRSSLNGEIFEAEFTQTEQAAMREMTYTVGADNLQLNQEGGDETDADEAAEKAALLQTEEGGAQDAAGSTASAEETAGSKALAEGAVLTDKIRIMSAAEALSYVDSDIHKSLGSDTWLTDSGHDQTAAQFMTTDGLIMAYGDDVTDDSLSVCPVIEVDYSKLG